MSDDDHIYMPYKWITPEEAEAKYGYPFPKRGGPAVCINGHAMDEGLFECPACGAYRPSAAAVDTPRRKRRSKPRA